MRIRLNHFRCLWKNLSILSRVKRELWVLQIKSKKFATALEVSITSWITAAARSLYLNSCKEDLEGLFARTYSLIMWGWRNNFRFWISRRIFPTTSRLLIFCRLSILTATLCPVTWCLATVNVAIISCHQKSSIGMRPSTFDFSECTRSQSFACKGSIRTS